MSRAHLNSGRAKIGDFREMSRANILSILDSIHGNKVLVWDECLTGPVGLVAEYSVLKEHGVSRMFSMSATGLPSVRVDSIVYIIRPNVENCDIIAANIRSEERRGGSGLKMDYHIIFLPKKSLFCEKRLKESGVYGSLTIYELPIYLYPLDTDLLSMELPDSFKELTLEGDPTCIQYAAKALMQLQMVCGIIPRIYGKGAAADRLFRLMLRMKQEMVGFESNIKPQIDSLVLIDRSIDLLSTLPTQLTYEGLIDELFGISQASVKVPADRFGGQQQQQAGDVPQPTAPSSTEMRQVPLNSSEELYQDIRWLNFNAVGPSLSRKARSISAQFQERHEAKTVREMKEFVEKLPSMQAAKQSLGTHTTIAEMVKDKITAEGLMDTLEVEQEILSYVNSDRYLDSVEDLACKDYPLTKLLRIISMQSLVSSGLKPKVLDMYKKLVLQAYGYEHLLTLQNLEKAGFITPHNGQKTFGTLRKRLNLISDIVDEQNPTDIAYVHSVYAPLSVRLVQQLEKPGWRNIRDILDILPGTSFEDTQQIPTHLKNISRPDDQPKVVLVMFVGGCTMAEIAALRFLSQQEDKNVEYLIGTTSIITGSNLLQSLQTDLQPPVF
eukprot:TRINITY_DN12644_c0_g1_i2.p1 TRINITY_DN12644_c0_g1~~TRINITY_DN12644_c0_g1_i2.p1  ORF type:complete len:625 (+),score=133.75 TRINITY_DN12644_c0_g1_i2:46-1875(+)